VGWSPVVLLESVVGIGSGEVMVGLQGMRRDREIADTGSFGQREDSHNENPG
jgi:hypothetical protein